VPPGLGWIGSHLPQTTLPLREHGIIELSACFQVSAEAGGLALVDLQWQFQQKGRRALLRLFALSC
jgi:hypothetical protein